MKNNSIESNENQFIDDKKSRHAKIVNALAIGFLVGIVTVGVVAAVMSKKFVVLIPLIFPVYFIYKSIKKSKN